MRPHLIALAVAMGFVVLASNLLVSHSIDIQADYVWFGKPDTINFANWFTFGTFTFPLAFLITDITNRLFGLSAARRVVLVGFVVGVAMSIYFGDMRIGIASGTAFLVGQMLDVSIFDRLRNGPIWQAPVISSLVASLVDTFLFYCLAFAPLGIFGLAGADFPWAQVGLGDFGVKVAMAYVLLPIYLVIVSLFANGRKAEA